MHIIGLIAEYNPFHNGHLYQINKIKEKYADSILIEVVSSSFTQRGDASILDKWTKTQIALDNGIDIVVELPYVYATQSSDIFANGAVTILNKLGIDTLAMGYEKSTLKPGTLRQIRLGYEAGVDVSQYFRKGYRMREWQMHEIRLGLEAGIDVSSYNIKGTPPDKMCEIRGWKTHSTPELEKLAKQIDVSEEKDIYLKDRVLRRILSLDQVKEDYEFAKMVVGDYVPTKSNIVFAYSRHENKVSNLQLIMRGILIVNLGREKYTKELQEELKKLIHSKEEIILDSYNIPDTKKYLSEFLEEKIGKNLFDAYQVFKGTEPKDENNRYDNALNHFEKEFLKMKINLPFGEEE